MSNKSKAQIIAIVVLSCVLMALVDGFWQPGYLLKSVIKIALFLLLPMLYIRSQHTRSFRTLFKLDFKHLRFSLYMGISVFVFILLAYFVIGPFFDFSNVTKSLEVELGVTKETFLFVALYISFVNALLEEFFFRGFAFLELKSVSTRPTAHIISAFAFSLYHVAMMINWFTPPLFLLLLLGLFAGGLIFNFLNEKTGTIYTSWMVHMFANFAINGVGLILFNQV